MALTESYQQRIGAYFRFFAKDYHSYARELGLVTVDSSNTIVAIVENYLQRPGNNEGDLSGKIYNTNGANISLVDVEYSQVSESGPWLPLTILSGDPLYSFPAAGTPAGQAFNVPVEITDSYTGDVWFRLTINSVPFGNDEGIAGPFSFAYISPLPAPPASIAVPEESLSGSYEISWASSPLATYYELEEATQPDFSDAVQIYSGPDTSFIVEDREEGTYYYRVRAGNIYGTSAYLAGTDPTAVLPVAPPTVLQVPSESKTGIYTVTWTPSIGADAYELEEDADPNFGSPKTIYVGTNTFYEVQHGTDGVFYYRVRARRD